MLLRWVHNMVKPHLFLTNDIYAPLFFPVVHWLALSLW